MGKKDKKSKSAEQKARTAAKQEKKAIQKENKGRSKGSADSDPEDVDLDDIRAEYERKVSACAVEGSQSTQLLASTIPRSRRIDMSAPFGSVLGHPDRLSVK